MLADFFGDLSDNTLQECFLAFPVPPEEADFSGLNDVGNIIALLQKHVAVNIDQECRCDFAGIGIVHRKPKDSTLRLRAMGKAAHWGDR